MALRHWLQLALTEGIGPILIGRLVAMTGSAEAACKANASILQSVEGIGSQKSRNILESFRRAEGEIDAELARSEAAGAIIICADDPAYPELLKVIPDPPAVLWVRGTLEPRDLNAVAIVGSRRCSHYGREQADRFASLLAGAGVTVISGGARGVDSAAHRGAMAATEGRTVAVLGCGVDVAYPPENEGLFKQISSRGAVISEFPIGSPPLKENFPRRNRIISGMSRGVLVVEADVASGALITARQAGSEHGRPVFALPGRVDNAMSAGPHALIRDGATLVTGLEDILDDLGPLPHSIVAGNENTPDESADADELFSDAAPKAPDIISTIALSERQQKITAAIDHDPTPIELIISRSELPAEIVLQELTLLTLRGAVKRVDGQTYERRGNKSHAHSP
jgi:DNA processing protein